METSVKDNKYIYCFQIVKHNQSKYLLTQFSKPELANTSEALFNWLVEYLTLNGDYGNIIREVFDGIERVQSSDNPKTCMYLQGKKSCIQITKVGIHVFDTYYECTEELNKQYQMKLNTQSFMQLLFNFNSNRIRMENGELGDNTKLPILYKLEEVEFSLPS